MLLKSNLAFSLLQNHKAKEKIMWDDFYFVLFFLKKKSFVQHVSFHSSWKLY